MDHRKQQAEFRNYQHIDTFYLSMTCAMVNLGLGAFSVSHKNSGNIGLLEKLNQKPVVDAGIHFNYAPRTNLLL